MGKYFATDGIRNKADYFTTDFLQKIALGLQKYGEKKTAGKEISVLVGGDTRESSEWILADLERAFESLGIECRSVGVLPTPAINYVFYKLGFDFAIDVTASHNPAVDNGIKIMERGEESGVKLSADGVEIIEETLENSESFPLVATNLQESLHEDAVQLYTEHLESYTTALGGKKADFKGLKLGIDFANGATSTIGADIFKKFGAEVEILHCEKKYGTKINDRAGSTHLEKLTALVKEKGLDCGIAYDGDGDRCLMVAKDGTTVKGDEIMAIIAEYLGLKQVVVTVMSNQGMFDWAKRKGVELEVVPVGDTNVSLAMREKKIQIGGEECGHIILPEQATGDGMLTSLAIVKIMAETGKDLAKLAGTVQIFPQVIHNMQATAEEKALLAKNTEIQAILAEFEHKIESESGRLLVRPSGTEELIRITLWGRDEVQIKNLSEEVRKALKAKFDEILKNN